MRKLGRPWWRMLPLTITGARLRASESSAYDSAEKSESQNGTKSLLQARMFSG